MKQIILDFPKQFAVGIKAAENTKLAGPFANIIICGIGGSALPGSLIPEIGVKFDLPLFVHRDYGLPKIAGPKSLIICISFSGNTEETLSAYQEALEKKYQVIALCTGGKLKELAEQNNLPVAIVPNDCVQPRFGTGYLVAAVLKILSNCGIINEPSMALSAMAQALQPQKYEEPGKALAQKLIDKIPIIYAANQYKSLARIWKIKFNENSKVMAFWNFFPELNHNEMVGLTNLKGNFHFIIIRDGNDHGRTKKRMDLFANLAKEKGADVDFVELAGQTKLEKVFNCLLLGDWTSYYLALAYGQNPVPVEIVEKFKKQL
ncbi:MAG: bifunctional phosphoglucose/phosphomannose isomerase [Candidatus Gribaldobacteria bacterium]|nr:bifunctional phosphoglucose/phosphomannose isomerase [Candidatus Gribaldobacteria bacterium]